MAITLIVGGKTFEYAEQGTSPGWGECNTAWACAITCQIGLLSGPNDKNTTCVAITSGAGATNVGSGGCALKFTGGIIAGTVRSFEVVYNVRRGNSTEAGTMEGAFNGSTWDFAHCHIGCAGMCFDITSAGQVRYFTSGDGCGCGACNIITGGVQFCNCGGVDTIIRTCGSWITDGFFVGDGLTITAACLCANNGCYCVTTVTALILTVSQTVTDDAADATARFAQTQAGTIKFRARTIDV